MFVSGYIRNIEEALGFCRRYGISCFIEDGKLVVDEVPVDYYYDSYRAMLEAAQKLGTGLVDHPNCFLSKKGVLIATFSPYGCELTEKDREKMRRKGYDLRESGFDLYGAGTKTYVMAKLVSPLDE